jgi:hypothetical protein
MAMQGAWPVPEGIKSVEVNGYPMAYKALSNLAWAMIICIGSKSGNLTSKKSESCEAAHTLTSPFALVRSLQEVS